jgi:hypothetical protein
MDDPVVLFKRWYVKPLEMLMELENGDGGFAALAISCPLYERYATAALKESGKSAADDNLVKQLAGDFGVDQSTAETFWDVMRNGLLHQGMPKQKKHGAKLTRWRFSAEYTAPIKLRTGSSTILEVQPWLFTDKVLSLWLSRLDLIAQNQSFPWATIEEI